MDLKTLSKELQALQSRQEKYEDLYVDGKGDKDQQAFYKEMLANYRTETSKLRVIYISMLQSVKAEFGKE